jgi:hypothetical protein
LLELHGFRGLVAGWICSGSLDASGEQSGKLAFFSGLTILISQDARAFPSISSVDAQTSDSGSFLLRNEDIQPREKQPTSTRLRH